MSLSQEEDCDCFVKAQGVYPMPNPTEQHPDGVMRWMGGKAYIDKKAKELVFHVGSPDTSSTTGRKTDLYVRVYEYPAHVLEPLQHNSHISLVPSQGKLVATQQFRCQTGNAVDTLRVPLRKLSLPSAQ